jgi:hypothetical protein
MRIKLQLGRLCDPNSRVSIDDYALSGSPAPAYMDCYVVWRSGHRVGGYDRFRLYAAYVVAPPEWQP